MTNPVTNIADHPNIVPSTTAYRNGCRCSGCRAAVAAAALSRRDRKLSAPDPITDLPGEVWADIPGYEGQYQASDAGRVRSLPRVVNKGNGVPMRRRGQIMKPAVHKTGYLTVCLPGRRTFKVHLLVLAAFVGPRPDGMVTRHLNGIPVDCRLVNLAYGTQAKNVADTMAHGTHRQASQTHCIRRHPLSGENLYVGPDGKRQCRACKRIRKAAAA